MGCYPCIVFRECQEWDTLLTRKLSALMFVVIEPYQTIKLLFMMIL